MSKARVYELAKKYGIARQTVSFECRKLLRQLGLPASIFMRSDEKINKMRVSYILRGLGGQELGLRAGLAVAVLP